MELTNIQELEEAFEGDLDLLLFYVTWIKNGTNAQAAYRELHPDVTLGSAGVLGSRMLKKVKTEMILNAYKLDVNAYMKQLKDGLEAMKVISARVIVKKDVSTSQQNGELPLANSNTDDFIEVPDHIARKPYHDKLGKLLGIEKEGDNFNQQNNYFNLTDEQLDQLIQSKSRQARVTEVIRGEATQDSGESVEVHSGTSEASGSNGINASDPSVILG